MRHPMPQIIKQTIMIMRHLMPQIITITNFYLNGQNYIRSAATIHKDFLLQPPWHRKFLVPPLL